MKRFFKKLLLGSPAKQNSVHRSFMAKRLSNIEAIWNNEHHDDIGIEKLLRLFLSTSQFLFPGLYIKAISDRKGVEYRELSVDIYVLFKVIFPILILKYDLLQNRIWVFIMVWFMVETLIYVPALIFASDILARPRSYRRSMLLLFFNYLEVTLGFAVLYKTGHFMNQSFGHWFDAVYFSVVTSGTIGFGDYYPVTPMGKALVVMQSFIYLIFVVLFLGIFSSQVERKGYFDHSNME